jgi:glycosyltransferase involved in cell wall biosynthesis
MTPNDIKISVVTVTYNSEKTLARNMESVLRQGDASVEHIIVDGKSTDGTLSVVDSYRDSYADKGIELKVISEKDNGPYDAMNKGIAAATGDVIGILNSDDCYGDGALEIVQGYVGQNPADIYMGAIRIHNGQNQIIEKHAKKTAYQTSRHFNHPAMFATKRCYEEVGKYGLTNVHSDYGWYLKAIKMGKNVCIINEVLTDFYIGGWSSKKSFKNTLDRISTKYQVYKENGYSRLYFLECAGMELAKFVLVKKS